MALAPSGGYVCSVPIVSVGASADVSELTELEVPLAEGEVPEITGSAGDGARASEFRE